MTVGNARWELSQLIKMQGHVKSQGHEIDYESQNRMRDLRKFLDSQPEDNTVVNETKTETKTADEIPF